MPQNNVEGSAMPTVHVSEKTRLSPDRVLAAARDFSEHRADLWPDVHMEHFTVHEMGETWADVTEGNPWPGMGIVWERLRYDWSQPGALKGTVIDSNLFKPGSTWEMRARADGDGSVVEVVAVRHLAGRGRFIAPVFPLGLAKKTVAEHLRHFLRGAEEKATP
jgi:hypothetical protein